MAENNGFMQDVKRAAEHTAKRPAKSPPVRVLLSITGNQGDPPKEVIRKVTNDHEVVEVDGFVFKRKRRVPPGESDNLAQDGPAKRVRGDSRGGSERADSDASVHPLAEPPAAPTDAQGNQGGAAGAVAAGAGTERAGEPPAPAEPARQAAAQVPSVRSVDAHAAAAAALARLPRGGGVSEAERLLALCDALAQPAGAAAGGVEERLARLPDQDELVRAGGAPAEALLRATLERFSADVRASLGDGTLECADGAVDGDAAERLREAAELAAELASQRASLAARLARFRQEEAQWNKLLHESTASAAAEAKGAPELPDGGTDEQPAAAAAAEGLDAEEGVTPEQPEQCRGDAAGAGQPVSAAQDAVAALGVLQQARTAAHHTLTLQVEGLCELVQGVQGLVAQAEQITTTEFDKLYKRSFSAVPGLNSPARLIREIARPAPSRQQAASDAGDGLSVVGTD